MSVPCARCGREYDVTLFEFGRTIWCTCGNRVGVEARVRQVGADAAARFIADAMLGKLAHWLRLLGFDCAYESEIADAELVRRGIEQGRIVLTRDRALPNDWRASGICLVRAERIFEQLDEVLRRFDLARAVRPFTRCSACNERLSEADTADMTGRAPAGILATHDRLLECPGCKRVYWKGSHTQRIQGVVDRLLAAR